MKKNDKCSVCGVKKDRQYRYIDIVYTYGHVSCRNIWWDLKKMMFGEEYVDPETETETETLTLTLTLTLPLKHITKLAKQVYRSRVTSER